MSSTDLLSHFTEHGYVRLPSALPPRPAAAMGDAIWGELERLHGIIRDRPATWTVTEPRGLERGAFDGPHTAAMTAAISRLLGPWSPPNGWGDPLVTFPDRGAWDVPTGAWHLDYPVVSGLMLKWLTYLVPVGRHGGGTVVLSGSHRLVERHTSHPENGHSRVVRDAIFGADPWLRSIREPGDPDERIARLMKRGATVSGIPLRVVELTGETGDVVFMHPHLFHAPAPNRAAVPRLMLTGGLIR